MTIAPLIDWSKRRPVDLPVRHQKPVDKSRVWGATGWEDQSGQRYEDGSWPWAGLEKKK